MFGQLGKEVKKIALKALMKITKDKFSPKINLLTILPVKSGEGGPSTFREWEGAAPGWRHCPCSLRYDDKKLIHIVFPALTNYIHFWQNFPIFPNMG